MSVEPTILVHVVICMSNKHSVSAKEKLLLSVCYTICGAKHSFCERKFGEVKATWHLNQFVVECQTKLCKEQKSEE
eukprot:UN07970